VTSTTVRHLTATRAHAAGPADAVVGEIAVALQAGLGSRTAAAVVYFASADYDPTLLAGPLAAHFPGVPVIGCSTAGEFTDQHTGTGGVSAVALPAGMLVRAAAALGDLSDGVATGTDGAIARVEAALGTPLRDLDPTRHVGIVLIDGLHGQEEQVNERLGNAAPVLDVVGGSAGDDLAFRGTWVAVGDRVSWNGVALLVAEVGVPFRVIKSCSFTPTGTVLRITEADVATRTVLEFDGRPAVRAYAEAIGIAPERIDTSAFMAHPVGLMIDGVPWIRSPQAVTPDGDGLRFYAQILPGMDVELMTSGDLAGETATAMEAARADLGGYACGAVLFNCILRRLEIDSLGIADQFLEAFEGIPAAGFHTYGETWLGHVNQTLTGLVFG
jgi:hypothetical protein